VSEGPRAKSARWSAKPERQLATVARNISTRYLAILCETVLGLVMLPFNLNHLGAAQYGLWMLVSSVTVHFSVLDMGYGGSLVKFVAYYRARRDSQALNEIASTMFFLLASCGVVAYAIAVIVAFNLGTLFPKITPDQAEVGKWLLLMIGFHVALAFPFGIFGGITGGFQRYDANSVVAIATSTSVAFVNVVLLWRGHSLLTLVACTTCLRIIAYFVYRMNAYRVYPDLRIRPSLFRRERLKEVTGFSVYSAVIDWANKLNYQLDQVVVGAFLGSAAVAVWAVAERIVAGTQRLTNQLNGVLFPVIVSSDATNDRGRLQQILQQGTLLSLATVLPIAVALIVLADPLIRSWTRNAEMLAAVPVLQILAVAVAIRVGNATGSTLLKGSGQHKLLAFTNLGAGVVNIVLSVVLVRHYGIVGVAVGTVIPIATAAIVILNPAACRRVGLPISQLLLRSVFPAVWPGLVMAGVLLYTRSISSGTLLAVAIQAGAGGVLYLVLLIGVAIGRHNRQLYITKAKQLLGRRRERAAAPATARPVDNSAGV
jgi:O-antigen/teichoic acid export membrane protein